MKKKFLREDNTMLDTQRSVGGIGQGSKDDPFIQLAIPLRQGLDNKQNGIKYPYEIERFEEHVMDIFKKLIDLRITFENCKKNPSVKEAQKVGLKKSVDRIDAINQALLQIPDFLTLFSVDK